MPAVPTDSNVRTRGVSSRILQASIIGSAIEASPGPNEPTILFIHAVEAMNGLTALTASSKAGMLNANTAIKMSELAVWKKDRKEPIAEFHLGKR